MKSKTILQFTPKDLRDFTDNLDRDHKSALEFVTHPREYLAKRGYLVPTGCMIRFTPTEEIRARFNSERLFNRYIGDLEEADGYVKVHLKGDAGGLKCAVVDIPCEIIPQEPSPIEHGCAKNIYTELSMQELFNIMIASSKEPGQLQELVDNPQSYLERQGYYVPSPSLMRFAVRHVSKIEEQLKTKRGFDDFFHGDQIIYWVHVGGLPENEALRCTTIGIICD